MTDAKKYTKADLIDAVAEKTNYTKKETREIVNATFETLKEMLPNGVTIQGFAKFGVRTAAPRKVRNFQSGAIDQIGARTLPKVKFSREIVGAVKA